MPLYTFSCGKCGYFDAHAPVGGISACPTCNEAGTVSKVFLPTVNMFLSDPCKPNNHDGNVRLREWANSPRIKKKRDLGILRHENDSVKDLETNA